MIQTFTGKLVDPFALRVSDVCIEDVAHALSNICRFGGHCRFHYSVAQHCVYAVCQARHETIDPCSLMWVLLHDAAEAYLGDIPRPIKRTWPGYAEAEGRALGVIAEALGCKTALSACAQLVAEVDSRMLATERRDVMAKCSPEDDRHWHDVAGVLPYSIGIVQWAPEYAKSQFWQMYESIRKQASR